MVVGSAIRDLATSNRRDIFLAALFEKTIYVWSTVTGEKFSEYDTIMDFGGSRLTLGNSKDFFVAGAYTRYGIASYRLTNGTKLWHRKDLKGVQKLRISPNDNIVFCGFSDKPAHILKTETGVTVETLKSVRNIFFDSYSSAFVYEKAPRQAEIYHSKEKLLKTIKTTNSIYLFDVAFSPDHIAVSTGDVYFVSRHDPDKTIVYHPPEGCYIQRLAYSPKVDAYFGVQYYTRKAISSLLLRFDLSQDEPGIVTKIERSEYAFCDNGEHLIVADGQYINTITGAIEKNFQFPLKEYASYGSDEDE